MSAATLWGWRDELRRRGFAVTWPGGASEHAVRSARDAILAELPALDAVALRWTWSRGFSAVTR